MIGAPVKLKRELRLELQGLLLITRGAQSENKGKNLVSATLTRRIHSNIYKCKECITQQIQEIHLQAHNSDWKDKNEDSLHLSKEMQPKDITCLWQALFKISLCKCSNAPKMLHSSSCWQKPCCCQTSGRCWTQEETSKVKKVPLPLLTNLGARKPFKVKTTLDGRRVCKLEHNSQDRGP